MKQHQTHYTDRNLPMSNSNLVDFPKDRIIRIDASLGEISVQKIVEQDIEKLKRFRFILIREFLSQIVPMLFNSLSAAGFNIRDIKNSKNAALIVESLKAFMEKEYGISHQFHDLSEILFDYDEEGNLCLVTTLENIVVKEGENKENETTNVGNSGENIKNKEQEDSTGGTEKT